MISLALLKTVAKASHQVPAAEYVENQYQREQLLAQMKMNHEECRAHSNKIKWEEENK